jgi:hypothetical protein
MRIAAGILMIIIAITSLGTRLLLVIGGMSPLNRYSLVIFISAAFLVTGGVFCFKRKYWGFCFAAALLLLLILYFGYFAAMIPRPIWLDWYLVASGAILPIIFVCLRKIEWLKSQA